MTTVGILGAGQLGRMLALAGYPLGLCFRFLDPAPGAPAGQMAEHIQGDYADTATLERFSAGLDVVTYEFENVPIAAARFLAGRVPVYPPPLALEVAQDRLAEKTFFRSIGAATPPFAPVDSRESLDAAIAQIGLPAVLKTRRLGYDGKGQMVLRAPSDLDAAWAALGATPLILEGFVRFERELSILAARGRGGETAFYPLIENHHRDGILRLSLAPAPGVTSALQAEAEQIAARALTALEYVGVLAIELFEVAGDGSWEVEAGASPQYQPPSPISHLLVNEMAPRVHNSGHWTIEGAETSQFEQHLRAVLGLPLGANTPRGHSAMVNLIGALPDPSAALAIRGAHLHLYGKEPRPARKVGHITVRADAIEELQARLARALDLVR
ncbi:MAG TPA: 5-(carboxyamino)imidazole ribonucleotide synthase [Roseiflexaceae bacterium]|nr:5-(carboxyamino)imidazole ribonucleotide synthase [Roseiflexaceae bacterium]